MARGSIRARVNQVVSDNGSTDLSVVQGEQLTQVITLNWFTNLAGAQVIASAIEGDNSNSDGQVPTAVKSGASSFNLVVLEEDGTALTNNVFPNDYDSNKFTLVVPDDAFDSFSPIPAPGDAGVRFAFWDLEVKDAGTGDTQKIYVPLRGLIGVRFKVGG